MTRISKNIETRAKLMGKMMDRCDVDIQHLARERLGLTFASAIRSCRLCSNAASCEVWLAATAGEPAHTPPAFCPNAGVFEAMSQALKDDGGTRRPETNDASL
ncbi:MULTISPECIES: DUF6455 family protein [unclassified Nitratireductor]|uniref:DUF6455 family protein n=1 Tax=unclassified Nitratireductor TaxID=2641084 RepID=UPI0025FC5F93|nr:DUF6455 family protein [Nitratireductor sp.]